MHFRPVLLAPLDVVPERLFEDLSIYQEGTDTVIKIATGNKTIRLVDVAVENLDLCDFLL